MWPVWKWCESSGTFRAELLREEAVSRAGVGVVERISESTSGKSRDCIESMEGVGFIGVYGDI